MTSISCSWPSIFSSTEKKGSPALRRGAVTVLYEPLLGISPMTPCTNHCRFNWSASDMVEQGLGRITFLDGVEPHVGVDDGDGSLGIDFAHADRQAVGLADALRDGER